MYELTSNQRTLVGRIRPLTALTALLKFIRDPDDTPQVFRIVRALDGSSAERGFQRFCATSTGRAVLARESTLANALADRTTLRRLPDGSLGRAYLDFVDAEMISVEGLLDAAAQGGIATLNLEAARLRYRSRLHAMHDILHVITRYGTDELGEACLLAFTYSQNRTRGLLPIIHGLALRMKLRSSRLKVGAAIREGFELGRRTEWLAAQDWESLLARPLAEVRERLGAHPPLRYLEQVELSRELDARRRRRLSSRS